MTLYAPAYPRSVGGELYVPQPHIVAGVVPIALPLIVDVPDLDLAVQASAQQQVARLRKQPDRRDPLRVPLEGVDAFFGQKAPGLALGQHAVVVLLLPFGLLVDHPATPLIVVFRLPVKPGGLRDLRRLHAGLVQCALLLLLAIGVVPYFLLLRPPEFLALLLAGERRPRPQKAIDIRGVVVADALGCPFFGVGRGILLLVGVGTILECVVFAGLLCSPFFAIFSLSSPPQGEHRLPPHRRRGNLAEFVWGCEDRWTGNDRRGLDFRFYQYEYVGGVSSRNSRLL